MILLADSGSTKTDWALARNGSLVKQITTEGINPFFQTEEEISRIVHERLMPALDGAMPHEVHFYGAGCAFPEKNRLVEQAITRHLPVPVEIGSDLLGAARSLCGRRTGIACIMGTGSTSSYYDGQTIAANVSPLGYVLGDEGSGAVLGRLLVGDCLKNQLPAPLKEAFFRRFDLTPQLILEQVYKQPFPNRFLASLSPFLIEHIDEPCIHRLVLNSFKSFFTRNVMQYDCRGVKVHFTGSIAYYYREVLDEAARALQIELGHIVRSPLEGLVTYHSNL